MREGEAPAVLPAPLQVVGRECQVETVASQDGLDGEVQPVRDHRDGVAQSGAKGYKFRKARINFNAGDEIMHFGWAGADQVDLAHHALSRADAPGLPILLDVAP